MDLKIIKQITAATNNKEAEKKHFLYSYVIDLSLNNEIIQIRLCE